MVGKIPSVDEVQRELSELEYPAQLVELAERSGVSFHTLRKVRSGETSDPGLKTVGKFLPHLRQLLRPLRKQSRGGLAEQVSKRGR